MAVGLETRYVFKLNKGALLSLLKFVFTRLRPPYILHQPVSNHTSQAKPAPASPLPMTLTCSPARPSGGRRMDFSSYPLVSTHKLSVAGSPSAPLVLPSALLVPGTQPGRGPPDKVLSLGRCWHLSSQEARGHRGWSPRSPTHGATGVGVVLLCVVTVTTDLWQPRTRLAWACHPAILEKPVPPFTKRHPRECSRQHPSQ